jgi:hypothetical protein
VNTFIMLTLLGAFSISVLHAKDVLKDKSPDGKFALQIHHGEEGWEAAIINLRSGGEETRLEVYQNNYIEGMGLTWSKDSNRVAYFEPDRRGGTTHIYFRKGAEFEEIDFPEIDLRELGRAEKIGGEEILGKTVDSMKRPMKWLQSGSLVIRIDETYLNEYEKLPRSSHRSKIIAITFDADHKASVRSITDPVSGAKKPR